jgi:2-dehydro-3-deoxyphosphooctonate aldolase (KDO 8-P synthase)
MIQPEGVLKMEVTATDPAVSKQYAEALIAYSEEKVDNLSRRKRDNQVADAEKALEKAHQERLDAQERLLRLQQENAVVDPQGKLTAMRARITHFETELQLKRLRLQALLDNPRPNTAKLSGLKGDIRRLIALLDEMNLEMVDASQGEQSLADLSLQILMAQGDLQTRDMMLQRSLENLIQTQREARLASALSHDQCISSRGTGSELSKEIRKRDPCRLDLFRNLFDAFVDSFHSPRTGFIIMKNIECAGLTLGNTQALTLIAGPCQLESAGHAEMIAGHLKEACAAAGAQFVFKASFDKANRTSLSGQRGIGLDAGLKVLQHIKETLKVPVLTDIHSPEQCAPTAEVCDILQIPAFLCRQTDLLLAAGQTGAVINVKKGQFLAPWDMPNIIAKIESTGNQQLLLTERGTSFGYNTLVADMRALPQMARSGYPVVMDATHSVAQPGGKGTSSGGQREFAPVMARAAVALGIAAVFIETHENPDTAPSDGPNMIVLDQMPALISTLMQFDQIAKANPIVL